MKSRSGKITRRAALERLSAGALLSLGLWPGTLRAADSASGGSFRFIVVNDTHYLSAECGPWLEGVVRQMKGENAAFCLHAGDLTEEGGKDHLGAVHEVFRGLGTPMYPVIGNHDYVAQTDRAPYASAFPDRLNYHLTHEGWQFLGLDSSEGQKYQNVTVSAETLRWLDDTLPKLDPKKPTVIFTHFPLGDGVIYRPSNAEALLNRFRDFNLQAAFSGHFHGFTEKTAGKAVLTTNRCCALKRNNHDGTQEKGYFVCAAREGRLTRTFVEYKGA